MPPGRSVSRHIKIGIEGTQLGGASGVSNPWGFGFCSELSSKLKPFVDNSRVLVAEEAALFLRSAAAGSHVAAGRSRSAAAGFHVTASRSRGAATGLHVAAVGSTARGTRRSAAARSHVAALGSRGAAAGLRVATLRCRAATRGFFLATIEQAGFSVNRAKATNHHSGGQSDPFHFSASPRKV